MTRALPFAALERLEAEHELDVWEGDLPPGPEAMLERASAADGLLSLVTDPVGADLLAACPDLKAIANMAVGTDNIDLRPPPPGASPSATRPTC